MRKVKRAFRCFWRSNGEDIAILLSCAAMFGAFYLFTVCMVIMLP